MTNEELIQKAKSVATAKQVSKKTKVGNVGSALITDSGNVFMGASIDAIAGLGFCGEASAISAMLTAGESKIKIIVSVNDEGKIYSPCGRCREFIKQVNMDNVETDIILIDKIMKLKDLLPEAY